MVVNFSLCSFCIFKLNNNKINVNYFYLGTGGRARGGRYGKKKKIACK